MRTPSVLGLLAGLASAGTWIGANLRLGDPGLVSIAPDTASVLVMAGVMIVAVIAAVRHNPDMARRDAWHVTFVGSGAFAIVVAGFTRWYLPQAGPFLGSIMSLAGMALVSLGGAVAGRHTVRARTA